MMLLGTKAMRINIKDQLHKIGIKDTNRSKKKAKCEGSYGDNFLKCCIFNFPFEEGNTIYSFMMKFIKSMLEKFQIQAFLHYPGKFFRDGLRIIFPSPLTSNVSLVKINAKSATLLHKRENGKIA